MRSSVPKDPTKENYFFRAVSTYDSFESRFLHENHWKGLLDISPSQENLEMSLTISILALSQLLVSDEKIKGKLQDLIFSLEKLRSSSKLFSVATDYLQGLEGSKTLLIDLTLSHNNRALANIVLMQRDWLAHFFEDESRIR